MNKLGASLLDAKSLWERVDFSDPSMLLWKFESSQLAKIHLRTYEPYLAHWGWQHNRQIKIMAEGGLTWNVTPRREEVQMNFLPLPPHPESSGNSEQHPKTEAERFLVFAEGILDSSVVDLLSEIKNSDSVIAIVNWETQKQVVMNAACSQIPIGDSLEECLNWSRHDYWERQNLDDFERACRQELRADSSNRLQFEYLTFDPLDLRNGGDGDWIRIIGEYRFLDCGRMGMFQLGRNIEFQRVAPPR